MPPTRISQKNTVASAVSQKTISAPVGWTLVSQKTNVSGGTAIMQKPATGYTEVAQK